MRTARLVVAMLASGLVAQAGAAIAQPNAGVAEPDRLLTPDDQNSRNMSTVAEAPLSDLNLMRQKIPPILLAAVADPYAPLGRLNCRTLSAEIDRLYVALGRDFDDPPPPKDGSVDHMTRPSGEGLKLMHSAAQFFIPYDGFLRTLSGAQKHDQHVLDAINAGNARRAYLKGLGEARNCPAPATPRGHGQDATTTVQPW